MEVKRRQLNWALLITLGSALVVSFFFLSGLLGGWQNRLNDLLFLPRPASDEIIIAAIDDKSLRELGRWPWPRYLHAELIKQLKTAGAKLIVFDVNFSEPASPSEDRRLAQAMQEAGNVILPVEAEQLTYQAGRWQASFLIKPLPIFAVKALALAHVNITPDNDNIVRRLPAFISNGEEEYPSLGIRLGELAGGQKPQLDQSGRLVVNFLGRPGNFSYLSVAEILKSKTPQLKDKIVIIGATAADLHDTHLVPTGRGQPMPGAEVHASVAQTVLERRFLREQGRESTLLTILSLAFLTSLLVWYLRPLGAALAALFLALVYGLGNLLAFEGGFLGNALYGLLAVLLVFLISTVWRYLSETQERERVVRLFGKYVAPQVVKKILAAPSGEVIPLGGSRGMVSVLFADIRGFTPTSEKMEPEAVVMMLNAYLTAFSEAIFAFEGTLDKFVGDEVMALYNTPLLQKDHAARAVGTALLAFSKIEKLHQERPDLPRVNFGVGIHSGEAVIGNIGSRERVDFTAIGDTINLGARLMGIAKAGQILVSKATYELTKDQFTFNHLEPVVVKGKAEPVEVYEVIGERQ